MLSRVCGAGLTIFALAGPAIADPDVQTVLAGAHLEAFKTYVSAEHEGMSWYQTVLASRTGVKLYCAPEQTALQSNQLIDIVRRYVAQNPSYESSPFGMVLMIALQEAFPCRK
jgi:hypothetical protein